MYIIDLNDLVDSLSYVNPNSDRSMLLVQAKAIVTETVGALNSDAPDNLQDRAQWLERELKNNPSVEPLMSGLYNDIRNKARNCGWDPRLKFKVIRELFTVTPMIIVGMDLDATLEALNETMGTEIIAVDEVISDTPTIEELEALQRYEEKRSADRNPANGIKRFDTGLVPVRQRQRLLSCR